MLSALAAKSGQVTTADAFAGLSTLAVAFFGLIGMVCPRLGGVAVLLFATVGAGLTGCAEVRIWTTVGLVGGLMLWFGRRNPTLGQTIWKLVGAAVLASVAALLMAVLLRR